MFHLSTSTSGVGDTITNGLESYVTLEQIGKGDSSIVYRVICKSGRLRSRQLALKKILTRPHPLISAPHFTSSSSLHHALHHPNTVSLFSSFSISTEHFHVLELCSVGSLADLLRSREPPTILESELRGVMKSLVDALLYLRKELVVHRDIKPSNILLTSDYRVKLSDFGLATRLHTADSTISLVCGSSNYTAPEIILRLPYGFAVDVWSLGCVMITSLSGLLPFDAKTIPDTFQKISQAEYTLPERVSTEAKELARSILQVQPENRIQLSSILSHSFFASSLISKSLRPACTNEEENTPCTSPPLQLTQERSRSLKLLPFPSKQTALRRAKRHSSVHIPQATANRARAVLGDISNTNSLRDMLCSELMSNAKIPRFTGPARRIVSDPLTCNIPATAARPAIMNISFEAPASTMCSPVVSSPPADVINTNSVVIQGGMSKVSPADAPSLDMNSRSSGDTKVPHRWRVPVIEELHALLEHKNSSRHLFPLKISNHQRVASPSRIPVGTTRPLRFSTSPLNSQTHKTTYGQVTILPSRSLLVDFRESQRRRGLKGDEIFVIDPEGYEIAVYSAPHLSTPCCLVEPAQRFTIQTLPSAYWKQYNDASRLVDQIKQRTPRLIFYTVAAKCTLMANIPRGDIELLFHASTSWQKKTAGEHGEKQPSMRIRFSRQCQSIEIAQRIFNARVEEWTKKTLSSISGPPYISATDWETLETVEKEGMNRLEHFTRTCEAIEGLIDDDQVAPQVPNMPLTDISPASSTQNGTGYTASTILLSTNQATNDAPGPTPTIANTLSFPPRPPKLPSSALQSAVGDEDADLLSQRHPPHEKGMSLGHARPNPAFKPVLAWSEEDRALKSTAREDIQTRFIPSVGWCIRHGSGVPHGGRYKIMFLDGVTLDIDVDEEWVEFKSRSGGTTRHDIRDCNSKRKMGERMKVFQEFISLFDDSQE